jgi:hypothetical protein
MPICGVRSSRSTASAEIGDGRDVGDRGPDRAMVRRRTGPIACSIRPIAEEPAEPIDVAGPQQVPHHALIAGRQRSAAMWFERGDYQGFRLKKFRSFPVTTPLETYAPFSSLSGTSADGSQTILTGDGGEHASQSFDTWSKTTRSRI